MKPSVLFIFTSFAGHLNKTTMLARYYARKGATITYLIHSNGSTAFKPDFDCNIIHTHHFPVGVPRKVVSDDLNHVPVDYDPESAFVSRRDTLISVLKESSPTLIYMDCFCTNDYIMAYDHLKEYRTIVLEPWLPNVPGQGVPPMHSGRYPNRLARLEWLWTKTVLWSDLWYDYLIGSKVNLIWLMRRVRKEGMDIPPYHLTASKNPVIHHLEWWYMYPSEMDFFQRNLPDKVRYLGPAVDDERTQAMQSAVTVFLKKVSLSPQKTLIYCTFGTVVKTFVSRDTLLEFYSKLNLLAKKHPEWHILVSVSRDVIDSIRPSGMNIMFAPGVPQLEVLKHANVCINHGGGGTVLECATAGVPMLCIPAAQKVDYCGNTARVCFHKLGLKTTFGVDSEVLEHTLQNLLTDPAYSGNAKKMAEQLSLNYGPDYLESMDLPQP